MKYLQLYDHLGNLIKEFEVYVDGQDFNWAAIKPEPIWLGTIRLASAKAAEPVEPTPEPEPEMPIDFTPEEERIDREQLGPEGSESEPELEAEIGTPEEMREIAGALDEKQEMEEEVKYEPEKQSHKSRRAKRTGSPAGTKRSKAVPKRAAGSSDS